MNRNNIIAIIVLVILVSVGVWFFISDDEANDTSSDNLNSEVAEIDDSEAVELEDQTTVEEPSADQSDSEAVAGVYTEYNQENLVATAGTKQIVFFHADWCPTCRAFERRIQDEGIPKGITILKVDYDSNPDLRQQYGVPYTSYLVYIDSNEELVDIWYTEETPNLSEVADRVGV